METTRYQMSRDDTSWQDDGLPTTPWQVALVEGGHCVFKRHMPTDPNATSLSTTQWENMGKNTHGAMTQNVRESAAAADLNPFALNWQEWQRWLDVTPWHAPPIFPVACLINNLFFFIVRFPPIHIAPYITLQTFPERSRKSPFLKRSASKAFQRILTTPPSDFADASVIVKLPPNWVKLPFATYMAPAAEMQSSFVASKDPNPALEKFNYCTYLTWQLEAKWLYIN